MRNLQHEKNTIIINTKNYQITLEEIRTMVANGTNLDLSFLKKFLLKTSPHYQQSIQHKIDYLLPGKSLLDQTLASIQAIVGIEESERDKNLEKTIQSVAAGIGVASLIASSNPNTLIEKPPKLPFSNGAKITPHPFLFTIVISLFFGILTYWLFDRKIIPFFGKCK